MQLDYPFSNHMVLQHHKKIKITGTSQEQCISITFLDQEYFTQVNNNHWCIEMYLENIGGPYVMTIDENGKKTELDDIYIGDVYLAAGQSNMEFKVKQLKEYKDLELSNKVICYVNVPQNYYEDQDYIYPGEKQSSWQKINQQNIGELSAVAYYFASTLNVDIPIGIISNNKGGTSASCWINEDDLKQDKVLKKIYYDEYYDSLQNVSKQQQKKDYLTYQHKFIQYQMTFSDYTKKHPELKTEDIKEIIGHTPWPPPKSYLDFLRPCGLYHTMFLKTLHYPICGILWYQGEEDVKYADFYESLLSVLIKNWRRVYQEELPFYIVQLPEFDSPVDKGFSKIRFAQDAVTKKINNTYLIVTLGAGNPRNIHPENKKEVGQRLANCVMKNHYHQDVNLSPNIINSIINDQYIQFIFDQDLKEKEIELKGINHNHERIILKASIKKNSILIPRQKLTQIIYADDNVPQIQITSQYNLPAGPFQIDIQQT